MAQIVSRPSALDDLRHRRDRARNMAFLGFGLSFFAALALRYGDITLFEGRRMDAVAVLGFGIAVLGFLGIAVGLLLFVAGSIRWGVAASRIHRLADPWAYDPDLDGPDPNKRHELNDTYDDAPDMDEQDP